jgi:hypothetical protein
MTHPTTAVSVAMIQDDADANLPRPYGDGFEADEGLDHIIAARLERRERARRFWGRLAGTWLLKGSRFLLPVLFSLAAIAVMARPQQIDGSLIAACAAFATFCFLTPSLVASNYALWTGLDRLGARDRSREERDGGVERILNALTEARLHELMRSSNQYAFAFLLWLADRFPEGDETRGLLLVGSVLAASIALAHTFLIEQRTPKHSDRLPFLVHHAPSQHQSTLGDALTEILQAHLDPESATRFKHWRGDVASLTREGVTPAQAIERLLHLIHLEGQNLLTRRQMIAEVETVFKPEAVNSILFENRHLDLPTLSRLMGHTRAWQRGLFRQLDRLQFDLMDHNESLAGREWRMDASLPNRCGESRGDLFVLVNNLGTEEIPVELEVHVPDGQPSRQLFRLTPGPLPSPDHPLPLSSAGEDDVVEWLPRLTDAAHVLWLGVAWVDGVEGRRPVRLELRHVDGRTIRSDTLWTQVHARGSRGDSMRRRMELARTLARRWQKQALARSDRPGLLAP